jgi:hypothetical protein
MNIDQFNQTYASFKDANKITITCDHPSHDPIGEIITIGKQPARRNILKNSGKEFICRQCFMFYKNPMTQTSVPRQTDEVIDVFCPHHEHQGDPVRQMKKACYYGVMEEPYLQVCGSCVQKGKVISEEQKEAISKALKGIKRSEEFKEKLREYMLTNEEGIQRAKNNLVPGAGGGWNQGKETPEEVRKKQSEALLGRIYDEEHRQNISEGRKKMLEEQGGFSREHREKLSKATVRQYAKGFDPKMHHLTGIHKSLKAGEVSYRSSYEKKAYMKLDEDETVKTYKVEGFSVEYFHPIKKITSNYIVDLEIEYIDGSKKYVEVKPEKWLTDEVVCSKVEAAQKKAAELGVPYEIWTEMHLFGHVYNEKNMRAFVEKIKKENIDGID